MIKIYTHNTYYLPDDVPSGLHIAINPSNHTNIRINCSYSRHNGCDTCTFTKKCNYDAYRKLIKETVKILSKVEHG